MLGKILLIMVLISPSGQQLATFTEVESLQQCNVKRERLTLVLTSSDSRILAADCSRTKATFTPFSHRAESSQSYFHYYIHFQADAQVTIVPYPTLQQCIDRQGPGYCASSRQSLITPAQ